MKSVCMLLLFADSRLLLYGTLTFRSCCCAGFFGGGGWGSSSCGVGFSGCVVSLSGSLDLAEACNNKKETEIIRMEDRAALSAS